MTFFFLSPCCPKRTSDLTLIEAGSRLCARRAALMPIVAAFFATGGRPPAPYPTATAAFLLNKTWGARILIHKKTPSSGETIRTAYKK